MSKAKGSRTERELFHMFFKEGFIAVRAAGSGSTPLPNPDLIVGGKGKYFAIECKAVKAAHKYFPKEEIEQLSLFAKLFGAEAYVGLRFDREKWRFLTPSQLKLTEKGYFAASKVLAKNEGKTFEDLVA